MAAIGTIGDLGPHAPFPIVEKSFEKYGRKNIANSVVKARTRFTADRKGMVAEALKKRLYGWQLKSKAMQQNYR
ncbi:MAG: hypothetical protein IBX64_08185 [Actinobacteria bacterium]|nr:hypothetical protein [Actinomycetota bacterium]